MQNSWKRYAQLVTLVSEEPYDADVTLAYAFDQQREWEWTITVTPTGYQPFTASAETLDEAIAKFRILWRDFLETRQRSLRFESAEVRDALRQMKEAA